jgi:uncharacterized protein YutE (UPF0331/DUF86 family)
MTPRSVDPESVTARLRLMRDALDDLESLGDVDARRLAEDRIARRVVERLIAHLVDTAAAINAHLSGAALGRAPRDLADSFDLAVEAAVLPADLGGRLRQSAGMRNVIVHAYDDLDLDLVAKAIPAAKADFGTYVSTVATYLRRRG